MLYIYLIILVLILVGWAISIFPLEPLKAIISMILASYLIAILIGKLNQKK